MFLHSRFLSLDECFNMFDELFTPSCFPPRINTSVPIHICATSPSGDICQGDSGGALVSLDKDNK